MLECGLGLQLHQNIWKWAKALRESWSKKMTGKAPDQATEKMTTENNAKKGGDEGQPKIMAKVSNDESKADDRGKVHRTGPKNWFRKRALFKRDVEQGTGSCT